MNANKSNFSRLRNHVDTSLSYEENTRIHTLDNSFNIPTQPNESNKNFVDLSKRIKTEHSTYFKKRQTVQPTIFVNRDSLNQSFNLPNRINKRKTLIDRSLVSSIQEVQSIGKQTKNQKSSNTEGIDKVFLKVHENIISNIDINYMKIQEEINDQNPFLFKLKKKIEIIPQLKVLKIQPSPNLIANSEKFGKKLQRKLINLKSVDQEERSEFSNLNEESSSFFLETEKRAEISAIKQRHNKTEAEILLSSHLRNYDEKIKGKDRLLLNMHKLGTGLSQVYGMNFRDYESIVKFAKKEFKDFWNPEKIALAHDMYLLTMTNNEDFNCKPKIDVKDQEKEVETEELIKKKFTLKIQPKITKATGLFLKYKRVDLASAFQIES